MLVWVIVLCWTLWTASSSPAPHSGHRHGHVRAAPRALHHLALHTARGGGGAAADTQGPRGDGEAGARQQEGQRAGPARRPLRLTQHGVISRPPRASSSRTAAIKGRSGGAQGCCQRCFATVSQYREKVPTN